MAFKEFKGPPEDYKQPENLTVFQCSHIGVSGTTPVIVRQTGPECEARMGFALFGSSNMSDAEFEACGFNPFHDDFHDNYVRGMGASQDAAIAALKVELDQLSESIWI